MPAFKTPKRKWPSNFDLQKLTKGTSKELGIHAQTVQLICEQYTKSRDKAKHSLRFRSIADLTRNVTVGDSFAEAILINSHDGSSTYSLSLGLFRLVCSNGMTVSDVLFESFKVRHIGDIIQNVIEGTRRVFAAAPLALAAVEQWGRIDLMQSERLALAEAAHSLRFPVNPETNNPITEVTPAMLLNPRRYQDEKSDLWSTFNVIQENATKGVRQYVGRQRVTSRAVKGIDGDAKLNKALWTLGQRMAEIKAGK